MCQEENHREDVVYLCRLQVRRELHAQQDLREGREQLPQPAGDPGTHYYCCCCCLPALSASSHPPPPLPPAAVGDGGAERLDSHLSDESGVRRSSFIYFKCYIQIKIHFKNILFQPLNIFFVALNKMYL